MYDKTVFHVPGAYPLPARAVPFGEGSGPLKAKLDNLDLIQSPHGFIVRGSLAKFYLGNNVEEFTFPMVGPCLDKLEAKLGFSIREGQVWELEIAQTLVMRQPTSQYLTLLGDVPRFKKTTFPNGLTVLYHNRRRSFQFYDKAAEVGLKGLPEQFRGLHLLRAEYKLKNHLSEILGHPLTVARLTDPKQYSFFLREWEAFALRIPKSRIPRPYFGGGLKEMKQSLASVCLASVGGPAALLADLAGRTDISTTKKSKMKAAILALTVDPDWTEPASLTQELEDKLREAVRSSIDKPIS